MPQVEITESESAKTDMVRAAETNGNGIGIAVAEEMEAAETIATGHRDAIEICSMTEEVVAAPVEAVVVTQVAVKTAMNLLRKLEENEETAHRPKNESQHRI